MFENNDITVRQADRHYTTHIHTHTPVTTRAPYVIQAKRREALISQSIDVLAGALSGACCG